MEATNRTLIDLYLAFIRTWILEYQLHSTRHTTALSAATLPAEEEPSPQMDSTSTLQPSTVATHNPGQQRSDFRAEPSDYEPDAPPAQDSLKEFSAEARAVHLSENKTEVKTMEVHDDSWRTQRKAERPARVRPSVPARPSIPALKPAELSRGPGVAVASHTVIKRLQLPKIVRMVLDDCKEHWENLALALLTRAKKNGLKTVFVTGARSGEGYTTVAMSLAVALAQQTDARVLLMDADFAHPTVARRLSLRPSVGLEQVVLDGVPLEEAVMQSEDPPLSILPMVFGFEFPAMAAGSRRFQRTMQELRDHYELIVMDGGCRFREGAPLPLLPNIDAALIVRNPAKTGEKMLGRIDEQLLAHGISSLGVIENEP